MVRSFWNEEWRELKFDEGALQKRYSISNYGRIVSYIDEVKDGTLIKGGVLRGYPTLPLRPFGQSKTFYVHKLVADLFLPDSNCKNCFVIHLDFNKSNNYINNLKRVNKEEMFAHQQVNPSVLESREKQKGRQTVQGHKLNATQVMRLKKKILDPNRKTRLKLLAKQFGISEMQLYRIKSGENWAHINVENNSQN